MSTTASTVRLNGLAQRLHDDGLIQQEVILDAVTNAQKASQALVTYLVSHELAKASDIARIASTEYGVALFDLDSMDKENLPTHLVEEKLIRKHNALPLVHRGKRLFLAISDPTNHQGLDEIKFHTGLSTDAILVEEDKLSALIESSLDAQDSAMGDLLDDDLENLDISSDLDDNKNDDDSNQEIDEAPVVRYVNKILLDAINIGASDIHFEPYEKNFRVRYRQDGMLHEVASPPVNLSPRITARLKVMARMNIAERRVPQDGRIKLILSKNRSIDFRVNTCPTIYGEKIVCRILDSAAAKLGIEALGLESQQQKDFLDAIKKPYGMILVTGPTGSGKTVSLYTALNILNEPEINISTAEDPVEIQVMGINQVNVNPMQGLTFAVALRAFLRQDPDIIMVGEIRDLETAEISIKAAQTGHLVLSTLHTNDAPQTLTRLSNMGIPNFNIASSVNIILAQRLARRLCEHCKAPDELAKEALKKEGFSDSEISGGLSIYKAVGCERCTKGYKGRVGIFEVMPVSDAMKRIIMDDGNSIDIRDQADKEGIDDLRTSGLKKIKAGLTSLEEINRVTKE